MPPIFKRGTDTNLYGYSAQFICAESSVNRLHSYDCCVVEWKKEYLEKREKEKRKPVEDYLSV